MPSALRIVAQPKLHRNSDQACACLESLSAVVAHVHGGCAQHPASRVLSVAVWSARSARSPCVGPASAMFPGTAAGVLCAPSEREVAPNESEPNSGTPATCWTELCLYLFVLYQFLLFFSHLGT